MRSLEFAKANSELRRTGWQGLEFAKQTEEIIESTSINFINHKYLIINMKASTAAFWILMFLILITGIVFIICILKPNDSNLEIIKIFANIMERVILLVGGGWLGTKIGENESIPGDKK